MENKINKNHLSHQNYDLGLAKSENSVDHLDKAEAELIRQINELANEDCSSSYFKRMRDLVIGQPNKSLGSSQSNGLKNLSQENHLSFANR